MHDFTSEKIIERGRSCLASAAYAMLSTADQLGEEFVSACNLLHQCAGRVIVSGIGKSGLVGQKIAATLNSTGTSATYLHATDAVHGDSGTIQPGDVALLISKSGVGETFELLIPILRSKGVPYILMTQSKGVSPLASDAALVLQLPQFAEADGHDIVPTSSTSVQMSLGDALAVVLMEMKGFSPEDFAIHHPGGSLGRKLLLRAKDLIQVPNGATVKSDETFHNILLKIAEGRQGAVVVTEGILVLGIITDGDIRRSLMNQQDLIHSIAREIMTPNPVTAHKDLKALALIELIQQKSISQIVVVGDQSEYLGMVHFHDLVKAGLM